MGSNYMNMWNKFTSQIDPNVLRQRIFEEAEKINNTLREPVANAKAGINEALNTIYPQGKGAGDIAKNISKTAKVTPEMLKNAKQLVKTGTKTGGPAVIGGLIGLDEVRKQWGAPGSDAVTRFMDTLGALGNASATGLGAYLGGMKGHPIYGALAGGAVGQLVQNSANKQAQIRRDANIPYEIMLEQAKKKALEGVTPEQLERYNTYNQRKGDIDNVSPQEWLKQIMLNGENYQTNPVTNLELIKDMVGNTQSLPQAPTTNANIPSGINYPNNYSQAPVGSPSDYGIMNPTEWLANYLGYGNQQPQQIEQVDDRPPLRPKAIIDNQETHQNRQPNADDLLLQRLGQLNNQIGKNNYKDYDPIQRAWMARAIGFTPYQIWGDYPGQETRLKNAYDLLSKEYTIRKDMEDRARLQAYRERLTNAFDYDPELSYIIQDPDIYKTYLQHAGSTRLNLPYDMAKRKFDRETDLVKALQSGNNTAFNTWLGKMMDIGAIEPKADAQIRINTNKAQTYDVNKLFNALTQAGIANNRIQMESDKANLNAMLKYKLAEMGQSRNASLRALAQVIASGNANEAQTKAFMNYVFGSLDNNDSIQTIPTTGLDLDFEGVN